MFYSNFLKVSIILVLYTCKSTKLNILIKKTINVLPDRCSIKKEGKDCEIPPQFLISVASDDGEYMIGLTCQRHKTSVLQKIHNLQETEKIPTGKILFTELKSVGTECIRVDPDRLIEL